MVRCRLGLHLVLLLLLPACFSRQGFESPPAAAENGPWVVSFGRSWLVLLRNQPMAPLQPSSSPNVPAEFVVQPALPAGLTIDPHSGVISGTPTDLVELSRAYVITARSARGSVAMTLKLRVLDGFTVDSVDDLPAVGPTNDGLCGTGASGSCSLRAALAEADGISGEQVVAVPAGLYLIAGGDLYLGDVAVIGAGPEATVLDAEGSSRLFAVRADATATLASMTLQNGNAPGQFGGCIYVDNANLTMADCTVRDGKASFGGGIGVAIGGQLEMEACRVLHNQSTTNGGGIDGTVGTSLVIRGSLFSANSTLGEGGAIQVGGDIGLLSNLLIIGNHAGDRGGGVHVKRAQIAELKTSTLVDNSARAGAAFANAGTSQLSYNTLAHNIAVDAGAALSIYEGTTTLQGNLLVDNTRAGFVEACEVTVGRLLSNGYNVTDAKSDDCAELDAPTDRLSIVPTGVALVPADNGGALETLALSPDSLALDAGGDACSTADQRGWPRPFDGDGDGAATCDAGAFELQ